MAKDEVDNSTIQMSPDELKRLHAELDGKRAEAAEELGELDFGEAEADEDVVAQRAPAKVVKVAKPEKAVAPAKPKKADPARYTAPAGDAGGGGLLILGGIGALLAGLAPAIGVIPMFQGMGDLVELILVAAGVGVLGHLFLGLGMFGAISRTGGVAALVGTLHIVAMLGLTFFLLAALQVIPIEGELVKLVLVAPVALPGTAWLLSGIWAFSATRGLGAMGVLHGIFGVLGGGAMITQVVGGLAGAFGPQEDLAIALSLGGIGSVLLGGIFLSIGMFGRLRRTPAL